MKSIQKDHLAFLDLFLFNFKLHAITHATNNVKSTFTCNEMMVIFNYFFYSWCKRASDFFLLALWFTNIMEAESKVEKASHFAKFVCLFSREQLSK